MTRVRIVRESGKLAVVKVCGDQFPVLPARPDNLVRLFAKEILEDGTRRVIGTGQRELDGITRNVAWWADAEEENRIDREWREALDRCTVILDTPVTQVD